MVVKTVMSSLRMLVAMMMIITNDDGQADADFDDRYSDDDETLRR